MLVTKSLFSREKENLAFQIFRKHVSSSLNFISGLFLFKDTLTSEFVCLVEENIYICQLHIA
jgi:hypothetical protein